MLPSTNENIYELGWRLRTSLFEQLIEQGVNSIHDLLLRFDQTEHFHRFAFLEIDIEKDQDHFKAGPYLTGEVQISKRDSPTHRTFNIEELYKPMTPVACLFEDDFDSIIELGSGYGRNLFILDQMLNQPDVNYCGAEYTDSGRGLSDMLAAKMMPHMKFQSEFLDHKNPDFSFLKNSKKALVFSCHSIEQVAMIPDDYCENLANSVPEATVIHLEPFGFQANPGNKKSAAHRAFALEQKYNLNLFDVIKRTAELKKINLVSYDTDVLFTQPENPTSIAIWNNKNSAHFF